MSSLKVEAFGTKSAYVQRTATADFNPGLLPSAFPGRVLALNAITNRLEWEQKDQVVEVDKYIGPPIFTPPRIISTWVYAGVANTGYLTQVQFVMEYVGSGNPFPISGINAFIWNRSDSPPNSLISPITPIVVTQTKAIYTVFTNINDLPSDRAILELQVDSNNPTALFNITSVRVVYG